MTAAHLDLKPCKPRVCTPPDAALWSRAALGVSAWVCAMRERTVVIVGAGFSGSALAINLLRRAQPPLRVLLIDRTQMARGLASARRPYPYLLNVPAGRMSADSVEPEAFLHFAQRRLPHAGAADFLPRELYGEYLESLLTDAERGAAAGVQLERRYGSVIAEERPPRSTRVQVHLADGRIFAADAAVLALGNPAPAPLPGCATLRGSLGYHGDPWQEPPQARTGESVLVVGAGLTMADVVLAGAANGAKISWHALSRRGLIPPPQSGFTHGEHTCDSAPLLAAASVSMRQLLSAARALARAIEARGGDWREAIAVVRAQAPQLWQRLALRERQRFLRHVRAYWDLHRHRLPESSWAALSELRRTGALQVHAGRLLHLERAGRQIRALYRPRGREAPATLVVDRVINCTGPDYDIRRTDERLLRSLLARGVACADPLGLGLMTDARGALMGRDGRIAAGLFCLGPMLRATHWETTAVAELREYAAGLAEHLLSVEHVRPLRSAATSAQATQAAYAPL